MRRVARQPADGRLEVQLNLVLPTEPDKSSSLSQDLDTLAQQEGQFYLATNMNIADLLVPGFMHDFLRKGTPVRDRTPPRDLSPRRPSAAQ